MDGQWYAHLLGQFIAGLWVSEYDVSYGGRSQ